MKNIVLFSGEVVSYKNENGQTGSCWYAIGGLAGLAAADGKSAIQNCSVAGYRIDADVRMQKSGGENWGGAEIGGLVGISFMDMEECAAETTIVLPGSIESVDNIRMGGRLPEDHQQQLRRRRDPGREAGEPVQSRRQHLHRRSGGRQLF